MKKTEKKLTLRERAIEAIDSEMDTVIADVKDAVEVSYFVQPDGVIVSNEGNSTLCLNDEPLVCVLYLDGSDWRDSIPDSEKEEEDYDEDDYFDSTETENYYYCRIEEAISNIEEGYFDDETE